MANKTVATKNTKATANKEDKSMSKKVATKKVETTAVAKTETKKVETKPVKNEAKINITMDEIEKMFTEAGITFKTNNCNYRIIQGGSSLNVHKKDFVFYVTDADFETLSKVKAADIEAKEKGNAQDKSRPNYIRFTTVDTLKMIIQALAPKKALATA